MSSVLIANRGEIAVRIQRAAAGLGLGTVAVYAPEDRDAPHVRRADAAHALDGQGAAAYLDAERIAAIGRRAGCSLVHPGYGFLSENPGFAELCGKEGLVFAGPSPELLELFGDKVRSRELARRHGVPVPRATSRATTVEEARAFFADLPAGSGVVVKAVSGGGGRGIRAVFEESELPEAFERCRSEAERAFGDGSVYVEQLFRSVRHVEVQVLGDGRGDLIHLWDRECTIQRRHQKLIEIAPSPGVPRQVRQDLIESALTLARATDYASLGTFEFLVEESGAFHFIEANPRLQVEHTVTEEVTGIDLVAAQIEVARGASLPELGLSQQDVPEPRGFAVQARVNAESIGADGSARPATGTATTFEPPSGPGVRVDTHGRTGFAADGRFDSLLAKVIAHRPRGEFASAAAQAEAALGEFAIAGVDTNLPFLRAVLNHPEFRAGKFTTTFVEDRAGELVPDEGSAGCEDSLRAPFAGTAVSVEVAAGDEVAAGQQLVVLEAMKMEHVLTAPVSGSVSEIRVAEGETVAEDEELIRLSADGGTETAAPQEVPVNLEEIRPDLAAVRERHEIGLDAARPQAVERRRGVGHRTARENVEDLCDAGTFTEYGALAIAAQRRRRSLEDLVANTPADGMVTGIGEVNGELFGARRGRCVVMSYDYTVLAGTQGLLNHRKTDRMLELAERQRMPVVLFAEGGGGRPGDTDTTSASGLDVTTFAAMGRLSGKVPTIGIAAGRCFAGNAALLGCCDVIIATRDSTIGMAGPAMIEGGGLGSFRPEEVGPVTTQAPNGVIDVLVDDEAEAVRVAQAYLSYFQGDRDDWDCADQRVLRHAIPENRVRAYDVREVVRGLADTGSVLELRRDFGVGVITALVRVEGRPMGLVANNPKHLGGAIDSEAADKTARFLQLCDAHGLPVLSLCDTPGFMVGPEAEKDAGVRHFSRLFVTGANLGVPVFCVVLRKGYGLGAQAMAGGHFRAPVATAAWPTGEIGAMGLEGAVRLGYRRELEAIADPDQRRARFDELLAEAYDKGKAVNAAAVFELDDVIDPADTRSWITTTATTNGDRTTHRGFIDTW
ncbi:carboxyl transferase domain-containing protein [Saccharopolyspora griseoalba]|uniref:biotin carboxylase n=1 Tax=Saccharopolyspora griseoalba TaxID=1431848 RepID=A0ABW2LJZ6_9PSEU